MNGNTRSHFQELDKATEGEACAPNGRQQNTAISHWHGCKKWQQSLVGSVV